jgi:hypothetical protein
MKEAQDFVVFAAELTRRHQIDLQGSPPETLLQKPLLRLGRIICKEIRQNSSWAETCDAGGGKAARDTCCAAATHVSY